MKKRTITMIVSLVLALALGLGGTLAYLTDTDADVNTMVLGNVRIEQHEYQRAKNADGTYKTDTIDNLNSYVLEAFENSKPLLPIVGDPGLPSDNPGYKGWDDIPVRMSQVDSYGGMSVFAGKNAVDKFVTVENTGNSDAYVRTLVALEVGGADKDLISIGFFGETDAAKAKKMGWYLIDHEDIYEIDGNKYAVLEFVYYGAELPDGTMRHANGVLPAGDTTYPNLAQVYLASEADNDDVELLDGNKNGTYDILVLTQAVQAAGFEDPAKALEIGFGEVNAENVQTWFGAETGDVGKIPTTVYTADELIAALEDGNDIAMAADVKIDPASMSNAYGTTGINVDEGQTIDGGGYTLDIKGAGGTWDSGINTTGGVIRNIKVTGSFRGIFINHNSTHSERVILENVTIDGTTYTISCDQGLNQGLTATDCTFNGWTSYAATLGDAKFIDCEFGYGNGYKFCRPYAPTEFVGCNFCEDYTIDPRAAVTFENCTINGQPLTAENLATLVTAANISNATVK